LRKPEGLLIPEIKAKIAKEAIRGRTGIHHRFRNALEYATGGRLASGDKDIHGQKNPHECGGTRPAWLFCIEVLVFKGVCYSVARSAGEEWHYKWD
jgi:hypothetical protein